MSPLPLPDPFVGGPIADADPRETLTERFAGTQRNFEAIARLMIDTGNRSIKLRFGTDTIAWPGGSPTSTVKAVTHGMGSTPVVVAAFDGDSGAIIHYAAYTPGATSFSVKGQRIDGASPAVSSNTFHWLALG